MRLVSISLGSSKTSFKKKNPISLEDLEGLICTLVSAEDNEDIFRISSPMKIREALKEMTLQKAPGPDGFPAIFYQYYWDIVRHFVECRQVFSP